ncbi:hypothetical protein LOTGIDRAFT_232383 [Lottia gigantea]|uniref:E1 ubiquitin-activating enzyme n=1 Tax=Lottia gigantea TaxID=225164 RepID=V4BZJ8_LOTGI|nr:hypothetical protein LOTGIDRAFT_232383 [Lottia gigantea]ESO94579.1 hypothetical protein LOTGIDRAFT_232383 [Lottia gigantea]
MASEEIDDSLYSRQRYVLGDSAMKRMAQSSVLLCGVGGLGIEIAKNIVLAGVKSLTIQDDKNASIEDLGTQFFLHEADINKNRAEASSHHLSELNPYVSIKTLTQKLDEKTDLSYLKQYQCIILTESPLNVQLKVNRYCRSQKPQIQFISSDVFGILGQVFCDFGDEFEVMDHNGEEPKEVFVANITQGSPGIVSTLDNKVHGFENDDTVVFKEVKGMDCLNGHQFKIKVESPCTFSIGETSLLDEYKGGGIASQVKISKHFKFESLEEQLKNPALLHPDLCKLDAPATCHLTYYTLQTFIQKENRYPNVWSVEDSEKFENLAQELNQQLTSPVDCINRQLLRSICFTSQGCLPPLCATLGGFVAQEALKALTGKFTPLNQWLYLDAIEVIPQDPPSPQSFHKKGDRYDLFRICVGEEKVKELANTKLFMVGCGAIGCEMLKNYALMGISCGEQGKITITDNDLIEKSNLNRQFLFRPRHIRMPKSTTAAKAVLEINPGLKIAAQQHKVCPQTEDSIYNDAFFESQDVIVNALDNVEARRYMDARCVTNKKPLLESGTMGTKGHVQVIVPHVTESYGSQRDPPDEDFPYCTVKSFPATIEHCIQWARDKFEQVFVQKPQMFNKFWATNGDIEKVIKKLSNDEALEGSVKVSKSAYTKPTTWLQCVEQARIKFEKYFNHKAKQLLHSFPLDTLLSDGSPFWQSPKRPPTPIIFDADNPLHMLYIQSAARLLADVNGISWTPTDVDVTSIKNLLANVKVPQFIPSSKRIETDESASKGQEDSVISGNEEQETIQRFSKILHNNSNIQVSVITADQKPIEFEKDDDKNSHIDYIAAAANPCCFDRDTLTYTMWDKWEVYGNKDFTLQNFLDHFKAKYSLEPSMVVHGAKMIFAPIMPGHMKRKSHTMVKLLKPNNHTKYMDLILAFTNENDEDDDLEGPPVRYYFNL